jgi:ABC-type transport system involved in Fe-S cluster assembly fused permease/ATPase subunit
LLLVDGTRCRADWCTPSAGALSRVIDRGTRGINFILSSMVFNVVPTLLEVRGACVLLVCLCARMGLNALIVSASAIAR